MEVYRPRGSFDIDSSFWDLNHKVRGALFFLSFDSGVTPGLPIRRRRWCLVDFHSSSPSDMLHASGRSILFTDRELSPWLRSARTATLFLWA